jgi:putative transposase
MTRLGRYILADQPLHVIQRGNNRQAIFFEAEDYACYRGLLGEAARHHGCTLHAYVLMTNHVHLLLTPLTPEGLPRLMQWLGNRYVRHVNTTYRRTGTLWEGRYRAAPIDGESHLLACYRYIELNPVRAGMVAEPGDYRWSSYRAHAGGAADALVSDHPLFAALGVNAGERQAAYRALFREALGEDWIAGLRAATNGGWVFGNDRFKAQIAAAAGRRVAPLPKGRPPEEDIDGDQLSLL